jgi:hypothetical protein
LPTLPGKVLPRAIPAGNTFQGRWRVELETLIHAVPWGDLAVASGRASHVPEALLNLLSPDAETRNRAYWQLDNEVVLQSDLYEAAYFVVPILIMILEGKPEFGGDRIYDLLYEIANGWAPATTVCRSRDGTVIPLKEACVQELRRGIRVFSADMTDPDPSLSAKAGELVGLLEESGPH